MKRYLSSDCSRGLHEDCTGEHPVTSSRCACFHHYPAPEVRISPQRDLLAIWREQDKFWRVDGYRVDNDEVEGWIPLVAARDLDEVGRVLGTALLLTDELARKLGARDIAALDVPWDLMPRQQQLVLEAYSTIHTAQKLLAQALGEDD